MVRSGLWSKDVGPEDQQSSLVDEAQGRYLSDESHQGQLEQERTYASL